MYMHKCALSFAIVSRNSWRTAYGQRPWSRDAPHNKSSRRVQRSGKWLTTSLTMKKTRQRRLWDCRREPLVNRLCERCLFWAPVLCNIRKNIRYSKWFLQIRSAACMIVAVGHNLLASGAQDGGNELRLLFYSSSWDAFFFLSNLRRPKRRAMSFATALAPVAHISTQARLLSSMALG